MMALRRCDLHRHGDAWCTIGTRNEPSTGVCSKEGVVEAREGVVFRWRLRKGRGGRGEGGVVLAHGTTPSVGVCGKKGAVEARQGVVLAHGTSPSAGVCGKEGAGEGEIDEGESIAIGGSVFGVTRCARRACAFASQTQKHLTEP
jgi:hypothetical protein